MYDEFSFEDGNMANDEHLMQSSQVIPSGMGESV